MTKFMRVTTRKAAIKDCDFYPEVVVKVDGGYMCFEYDDDYLVWAGQI